MVHCSSIGGGTVVTRVVAVRITDASEGHRHDLDALAGVVIPPVGIDIGGNPIDSLEGSSRVGSASVGHHLDIDEIGTGGIALVDAS